MGQVRRSLRSAQQRIDHLAPPLVTIVAVGGALGVQLQHQRFVLLQQSVGGVQERQDVPAVVAVDPDFSGQALRIDDRLHLWLTLACRGDDQACL